MGGTKTEIVQAPTTPAPSASETAADIYKAKLEYEPKMAALNWATQQQYMPLQAAMYSQLYGQYYPEYARSQQALQKELYPQQAQLLEKGAAQAAQRLESPFAYTPEEQAYINQAREEARQNLLRQYRSEAELKGVLGGGRAALAEAAAASKLNQAFAGEDINRRLQAGQQAQQNILPYLQILYPQIGATQPQINPYQYTSAVPSADTIYNAMFQASQPNYFMQQGQPSPLWQLGGQLGSAALMAAMFSSRKYKKNIKLWVKSLILLNN
jgi:K+-sensing histidine kinase KdpD